MSANKLFFFKGVLNFLLEILFHELIFFPMGATNSIGDVKFPKGFFSLATGIFKFFLKEITFFKCPIGFEISYMKTISHWNNIQS